VTNIEAPTVTQVSTGYRAFRAQPIQRGGHRVHRCWRMCTLDLRAKSSIIRSTLLFTRIIDVRAFVRISIDHCALRYIWSTYN